MEIQEVQTNISTEQTETEKAIAKVEVALAGLKEGGEELFTAEIATLETKLAELKKKAEAEAVELVADAKEELQQAGDKAKSFWQALGPWQRVANTILLVWILLRLLGAI